MAYDENLGARVRKILERKRGYGERKMFGGLCFTLRGHMCCGIVGRDLMLRLGEAKAGAALKQKHVRPMDFTGRPMKGMVYVGPAGTKGAALKKWVESAAALVTKLPPKKK